MNIIAGKRGCELATKIRETFGRKTTEKGPKTTAKRLHCVLTASLPVAY